MKSNLFKYIFFCITIGLIALAVYFISSTQNKKEENNKNTEETVQKITVLTELKIGISNFDTINPLISNNRNVQEISKLIYEPLLSISEDYKIENCLAKEWSKVDDVTYLVKLREDVKWTDGVNFSAQDVKFTIDKLKSEAAQSIYALNVEKVIQVDIIDEETVKITLSQEVPFFEYNLIFPILASHQYENEDFVTSAQNNQPYGTGRYKISANGSGEIELIKNEQWWEKKQKDAKIETIRIKLFASVGETYNAFKIGNIDMMTTASIHVEEYIGSMGYVEACYKGREFDFLALNCANNVLKNKEIREAIYYAIDNQNIVSNRFQDKYYTASSPLDFGSYAWQEVKGSYDPNKATDILTKAQWIRKNGTWQKVQNYRTLRTNFDLIVQADDENRVKVAELIKTQLQNIGFKITINKVSQNRYNSYLKNKNYDMILTGTNTGLSPNLETYLGKDNIANYENTEITNLLEEISEIGIQEERKQKYNRIQEIYYEECPYIGLYRNRNTLLHSTNLVGDIKPNNYDIFYHIENWSIQKTE